MAAGGRRKLASEIVEHSEDEGEVGTTDGATSNGRPRRQAMQSALANPGDLFVVEGALRHIHLLINFITAWKRGYQRSEPTENTGEELPASAKPKTTKAAAAKVKGHGEMGVEAQRHWLTVAQTRKRLCANIRVSVCGSTWQ